MNKPEDLLRRQAEWQKARAQLPWAEKLRLAKVLRAAAIQLRPPNKSGNR